MSFNRRFPIVLIDGQMATACRPNPVKLNYDQQLVIRGRLTYQLVVLLVEAQVKHLHHAICFRRATYLSYKLEKRLLLSTFAFNLSL